MCTVIPGDCGCSGSSSSGVTAGGVLAFGGILAAVAAGGWAFQQAWLLWLASLVVGAICVFRPARRVAVATCVLVATGLLWLARKALKRLRHRKPSTAVASPREYIATLYLSSNGRNKVIRSGAVPGVWTSADDVADEVRRRYIAVYGEPRTGELRCHAQPVSSR